MNTLNLPCPTGHVSDGYHTFDELYEHRHALFVALMKSHPEISWMSYMHEDGSMFEGWFVAGMNLPTGNITYHLPNKCLYMVMAANINAVIRAPHFDGHTSATVVTRIQDWITESAPAHRLPESGNATR